ncbi:MAG TPA: hypothetical protein VGR62_20390 [Candidatus Binatia bacterium]|jgi:spermidine synthase|nr:hypothetical protein [Candidatus Binatia bacterium]
MNDDTTADARPISALALGVVCLAVILLEISYTRIFSYKLYYYFTYLIIGIALLGGGTGGLLMALSRRLQRAQPATTFGVASVIAAATVLGGYWIIALTQLNAGVMSRSITLSRVLNPANALAEGLKLLLISVTLFAPFLAAGLAVSKTFASRPQDIGRLYFADLLGAGIGCAIAVPLLWTLTPPQCVQLAGALFVVGGLLAARHVGGLRIPSAVLLIALLAGVAMPGLLPKPITDKEKTMAQVEGGKGEVLFTKWNPVFRIDVVPSPLDANTKILVHDGMWGAIMRRFDGNRESLHFFDKDVRLLPFRVLGPEPKVAIIGAAGGHELLASWYYGAGHVTGIELNPVTVSLLTTHFADFTGHLPEDPRITLINAEARSFLSRHQETFDLVWLVAPDSYAAMNAATSGAFVLSESYLYTAEMVELAMSRLGDDGILCAQFGELDYAHKPLRTARYVATAREAFRRAGVTDFDQHVLVGTTASGGPAYSTVLLKKTPFTPEQRARFAAASQVVEGSVVQYPPSSPPQADAPVAKIVDLPWADLGAWFAAYPFDVTPVTDDEPFFWHFVRFRDALGGDRVAYNPEEAVGERLIAVLLMVSTVFAALCLLGPMLLRRSALAGIPSPLTMGAFFASIGLGFIMLEVGLIQRLTLFLGYPTHTLSVTLCTILISTGIGALVSQRRAGSRAQIVAPVAAALFLIIVFYCFGLEPLLERLNTLPFAARVLVAVALILPLGLCLGTFMPLGLRTIAALSDRPEAHVAWAWAVNGFFSVVGSVLSTMVSMSYGFRVVFLVSGLLYVLAITALLRTPETRRS